MLSARHSLIVLGLPAILLAGCAAADTPSEPPPLEAPAADAVVPPEAARVLAEQGTVRLLARVAPDLPALQPLGHPDRRIVQELREGALQREVRAFHDRLPADVVLSREFKQVPLIVIDVSDAADLAVLDRFPGVVSWHMDERHSRTLDTSLDLIAQPEAAAEGFTGAGTAVAVLDTGLDYTHADFGTCSAPGVAGCQVIAMEEVSPDDGELDDHGHGTNVAAIVGGVAPDTGLIGMDVFRSDGYAYSSDLAAAIDWIIDHQATYNIVALNMSLGGGQYTSECGSSSYEVMLSLAEAAGVVSAVATGNDGWSDSIGSPACAPSAVKVGAVYAQSYGRVGWSTCTDSSTAADQVTCFSNSASFIDLLAPGAIIDAGGYRMGGTSQATPHVAGALAVVAQAYPTESPADWAERLADTGVSITDARNGYSFPRIDVEAAIYDAIVGEAPSVSLTLDGGADYANERGVDADLMVTAGTEPATEMCLANADDGVPAICLDWTELDEEGRWWLSAGQGDKTVAVWVRDDSGRTSTPATASIELDTIAPVDGVLEAAWSSQQATLAWTASTDERSGVDGYVVVHDTSTVAPADCASGTVVYEGSATQATLSGLSMQDNHAFRVCAVDAAGNVGEGAAVALAAEGTIIGSVTIEDGAEYTAEREVFLALESDGAAEMCLSNTLRCAEDGWRAFESELSWYLPNVDGERTVSVWFRTASGIESDVATATIYADYTAPETGSVEASTSLQSGLTRVAWTGFEDLASGIDYLRVVPVRGQLGVPSCRMGGIVLDPAETATRVDFPLRGPNPRVGVCAVDLAGNESRVVVAPVR